MKMAAFLLLVAGWFLALCAVVLLRAPGARSAFVLAGLGVEVLGLVLVFRAHPLPRGGRA